MTKLWPIIIVIFLIAIIGFSIYSAKITIKKSKNMNDIKITSPAFSHGEEIPSKYTCEGENISPPLIFGNVPTETRALALLMDDPDVPKALRPDGVFDHWTLFNIPPETTEMPEGGSIGTPGVNGRGDKRYTGPCPPTEYEPTEHRYFFRIYALDTELDLPEGATKNDVLNAMTDHILGQGELIGTFDRNK